ncbi:uncharacterized protein DNG_05251 [Cephalotrichum gorgonifer]|uniref:Uncharacterized protein n=1 Tax=Cephalotrichum gorgonifer TaxID=2041049 RepID=A0AAE8SVD2_9PEZI|nr:uncharacterized protein DNG_05251 [Cephalotrichum gorgonifer]
MDGTHLSLRFKHGLHTIFLFVDPLQPVSAMTTLLSDVIRERYPDGELATSQGPTPIPSADLEEKLVYAKLTNPADPAEGWQRLDLKPSDTPGRKGITDGSVLAFAIAEAGRNAEDVEFVVDWPVMDEDEFGEDEGDETLEP